MVNMDVESAAKPVKPDAIPRIRQRRKLSIFRSLLGLFLGVAILFFFLAWHRDNNRRTRAILQAEAYVDSIRPRAADTNALPLNFRPGDLLDPAAPEMTNMRWLPRDAALELRGKSGPHIVAFTGPITLFFAADGRAVVWFDKGDWNVEWLYLPEFKKDLKTQGMNEDDFDALPTTGPME